MKFPFYDEKIEIEKLNIIEICKKLILKNEKKMPLTPLASDDNGQERKEKVVHITAPFRQTCKRMYHQKTN